MDCSVFLQDDISIWVPLDDARLRVRFLTTAERAAIRSQLTTLDQGDMHVATEQLDPEICASAVIDWENITADGAPLPCTPEYIRKVARWPLFAQTVVTTCFDLERYRSEALEDVKKN